MHDVSSIQIHNRRHIIHPNNKIYISIEKPLQLVFFFCSIKKEEANYWAIFLPKLK